MTRVNKTTPDNVLRYTSVRPHQPPNCLDHWTL